MANMRLFVDSKIEYSDFKKGNASYMENYHNYIKKVLCRLDAVVKMKGTDFEDEFQVHRDSLKNKILGDIHSKFAQEFDAQHSDFVNKPSQHGIASRFESVELFHQEISRIREIVDGKECIDYMDKALNALFIDPTSPFIAPLYLEIYIRHERLLIQYAAKCVVEKIRENELTEKMASLEISTEDESKGTTRKPLQKTREYLFLERYSEFLQYLFVAHTMSLPALVEINKDNIPGISMVNGNGY